MIGFHLISILLIIDYLCIPSCLLSAQASHGYCHFRIQIIHYMSSNALKINDAWGMCRQGERQGAGDVPPPTLPSLPLCPSRPLSLHYLSMRCHPQYCCFPYAGGTCFKKIGLRRTGGALPPSGPPSAYRALRVAHRSRTNRPGFARALCS